MVPHHLGPAGHVSITCRLAIVGAAMLALTACGDDGTTPAPAATTASVSQCPDGVFCVQTDEGALVFDSSLLADRFPRGCDPNGTVLCVSPGPEGAVLVVALRQAPGAPFPDVPLAELLGAEDRQLARITCEGGTATGQYFQWHPDNATMTFIFVVGPGWSDCVLGWADVAETVPLNAPQG